MVAVRSCVCLLVVLVHIQVAVGKPFLDWLMCMACSDEDITASTASTTETDLFDDFFSFDCSECPGGATTARPAQSISLRLPGAPNGISMNVTDNNGVMQFVLDALTNGAAGPAVTAAPATSAAPAAPAGAATPATTAAPAGNTTAAG